MTRPQREYSELFTAAVENEPKVAQEYTKSAWKSDDEGVQSDQTLQRNETDLRIDSQLRIAGESGRSRSKQGHAAQLP